MIDYALEFPEMIAHANGVREGLTTGFRNGRREGVGIGLKRGTREGMRKGIVKGRAEGIDMGKFSAFFDLVKDKLLPIGEAAARTNVTVAEFEAKMAEYEAKQKAQQDCCTK